ncbi:MAG: proton-conducting transporter membrane subunit [Candidatus Levybacteria bacterium]|nr:proton-conducting transporter membrane subunit [Candidatus Levybacteria bacterium]
MLLLLLLISPIVAVSLSYLVKKQKTLLENIAISSVGIQLIAAISIIVSVINEGAYTLNNAFSVSSFEALILLVTTIVGTVAMLHSVGYLRGEQAKKMIDFKRIKECYILLNLFLFCMYVAITTTNPIVMWIAIEATTLSTVFLISFFNRKADVEAAWKYLIINSIGLLLGLLGIILFLSQGSLLTGWASWDSLTASANAMNPLISKFAFIFILIGFGTKMGLIPMHTWKPDAYNKAPLPVVALLSGALLNVAFFAILRFKIIIDSVVSYTFSQNLFIFFGILSIALSALIIYTQHNYKRLLAYSSIEHAGIIMLGFGFGGIGVIGAILHMIYHAFAKSLLFLVSSNIALKYSSSKISDVTGMLTVMPRATILFIIGLLAVVGMPPFGTFFSEFYILLAGFKSNFIISLIAIISLAIVLTGFFIHSFSMIFGTPPTSVRAGESKSWTLIPIVFLAIILIVFSIFIPTQLMQLITTSAELFTKNL